MMKRIMQMNQRLNGSKPSTRRVARNTSQPANLQQQQAEILKKRTMQMNQRLNGSKPSTRPTRSTTTNKPLPADLMNKQAEMVKKQQARPATTALAAGSTRPSMTDIMQREQALMQYKGTTGAAAASSPANLQEQIAATQNTRPLPKGSFNPIMQRMQQRRMAKGGMTKKGKSK